MKEKSAKQESENTDLKKKSAKLESENSNLEYLLTR